MLGQRLRGHSPDQLRTMRRAGLVVAAALDAVREQSGPGMTTAELDRIAAGVIRGAGATPSFLGYEGFPASVCVSVNEEIVHGIPGSRRLEAGDVVSVDCGAIVDGWHGDAARSWICGGRDAGRAEDLALVDDTELAMWHGIAALRAGGRLHAVGEAVEGHLDATSRDYGIVEDYVGHGIGPSMHMDPDVPNHAVRGRGPRVPVGLAVAVEPMVTLGTDARTHVLEDEWTVVSAAGARAAHWENTVCVTEQGLWVTTERDGGASALARVGAPFGPLGD